MHPAHPSKITNFSIRCNIYVLDTPFPPFYLLTILKATMCVTKKYIVKIVKEHFHPSCTSYRYNFAIYSAYYRLVFMYVHLFAYVLLTFDLYTNISKKIQFFSESKGCYKT